MAVHLDDEQQGGCGRARDVGPNRNKKRKKELIEMFVRLFVYEFVFGLLV